MCMHAHVTMLSGMLLAIVYLYARMWGISEDMPTKIGQPIYFLRYPLDGVVKVCHY